MPADDTASGKSGLPQDFFTAASFGTLTGAAMITWVVTSVLAGVFALDAKVAGLVVALVVAMVGAGFSRQRRPTKFLVAFFNGFLIYLTVVGGTSFFPYLNRNTAATALAGRANPALPEEPPPEGRNPQPATGVMLAANAALPGSFANALFSPWVQDPNLVAATTTLLVANREQGELISRFGGQLEALQVEVRELSATTRVPVARLQARLTESHELFREIEGTRLRSDENLRRLKLIRPRP